MTWLIVALLAINIVATVALFVWVKWSAEDVRDLITELGQALRAFRS